MRVQVDTHEWAKLVSCALLPDTAGLLSLETMIIPRLPCSLQR